MLLSGKFVVFPLIYEQDCNLDCSNISRLHGAIQRTFRVGKIAPFKKILKQSDSISLISELGKQTTIERYMRFIQIVLYVGKKKTDSFV